MQVPALSSSVQNVLGNNSGANGAQRVVAEEASGVEADKLQTTGRVSSSEATQPAAESINEVAASDNETAVSTKVVTSADEVLGTSLGLNIDTTA